MNVAIHGWTDTELRLARLGTIALGYKDPDKGHPVAVDHFVVPPEVEKVYGPNPKSLNIIIPHESIEIFMPSALKRYGDGFGLICKGDGKTAHVSSNHQNLDDYKITQTGNDYFCDSKKLPVDVIKGRNYIKHPCQYKKCSFYAKKYCKEVSIFTFMIYDVAGFGVYYIDSNSYNSYHNIKSTAETLQSVIGRCSFVPLILEVTMEEKHPEVQYRGKTTQISRTLPILRLTMKDSFQEMIGKAREKKLLTLLPSPYQITDKISIEPPDEDIKPELLYEEGPIIDVGDDAGARGIVNGGESNPVEITPEFGDTPGTGSSLDKAKKQAQPENSTNKTTQGQERPSKQGNPPAEKATGKAGPKDTKVPRGPSNGSTSGDNQIRKCTIRLAKIPGRPVPIAVGNIPGKNWIFHVERKVSNAGQAIIIKGNMACSINILNEETVKSLTPGQVIQVEGYFTDGKMNENFTLVTSKLYINQEKEVQERKQAV